MRLILATVSTRKKAPGPAAELLEFYAGRIARLASFEHVVFATAEKLLAFVEEAAGRTRPILLLADSRWKAMSSEEFASAMGGWKDAGRQQMVMGIGPADGWTAAQGARADLLLSFGRITLPHELAAVVAAEQMYRALTIIAGHPYHAGH